LDANFACLVFRASTSLGARDFSRQVLGPMF
jgi:hypothetical protein